MIQSGIGEVEFVEEPRRVLDRRHLTNATSFDLHGGATSCWLAIYARYDLSTFEESRRVLDRTFICHIGLGLLLN